MLNFIKISLEKELTVKKSKRKKDVNFSIIREAIELKNKTEGVLTTTQYRHVEEFVDMCEDWVNYLNRIERN